MRKTLLCLNVLSLLTIIFSCVPPDPAMVYGWNSNTPVSTITGPRILHKIDSANITHTEYFSTPAGVLEQVKFYNTNSQTAVSYNSNNKVSKMVHTAGPNVTELNFVYNSAGKIINASVKINALSVITHEMHYWMVYNSAGKLIRLDRKSVMAPFSGTYTFYGAAHLTWSGDNIVKVAENYSGYMHPNGSLEPLDPMGNAVYKFEDYDNKISPYSTLPFEYNLGMSLLGSAAFYQCSYNNPSKMQYEFYSAPPMVFNVDYIYDTHNYLVSDASGITKFIYKAVQ